MSKFKIELSKKIKESKRKSYLKGNYDFLRFGPEEKKISLIKSLKAYLKKLLKNHSIRNYYEGLSIVYEQLDLKGQGLLLDIICYRLLGYKRVKLPINTKKYWEDLASIEDLIIKRNVIDTNFHGFRLHYMNLQSIGKNIKIYYNEIGLMATFMVEQYSYKNGKEIISVEKNDNVLDCGGCYGDTALYFAEKVGPKGRVLSFEFLPNNIEIFQENLKLNPTLKNRIEIVPSAVSNESGKTYFYRDNGPGSSLKDTSFVEMDGTVKSITIDDYIQSQSIDKVDFIKMDIEGGELYALEGARMIIERDKPKLAIAIYHSMDDMVNIPQWIMNLKLGYKIYLDHFTIHEEETVLFAKCN